LHAVINHVPLRKCTDWAALSLVVDTFESTLRRQHSAFRGCTPTRAGDDAGILVVTFDNREALDYISVNVAALGLPKMCDPCSQAQCRDRSAGSSPNLSSVEITGFARKPTLER
jgi:hypothetical protein